jgi:hypothetical protein
VRCRTITGHYKNGYSSRNCCRLNLKEDYFLQEGCNQIAGRNEEKESDSEEENKMMKGDSVEIVNLPAK